jgi:succinate-semialdehyde dehydrogenase/glutarate-semialdehyde dehydrogenase
MVLKEAVGPVAAFTPWNFPISQAVRKISAALAAGCSIVLKGPEETPAGCAQLMEVFAEAGVPEGVVNLVYGVPSKVSSYLVAHPTIKKISFTGSTAVGKQLAALAGSHMKRATMELGGHAPVIVFSDATIERALDILVANKFRNAGQNCIAPTRFLIHEAIFDKFVDGFVSRTRAIKVDDGFASGAEMGPLANDRRLAAMEMLTSDALQSGGKILTGGVRVGNGGFFFQPTVLTDVPIAARIMNEEPFGPVAIISRFNQYGDALSEANRLSYGLGAYVYTTSAKLMADVGRDIESGMVAINHHGFGLPELPFGGVKDSGYGRENGSEALEAYLQTKIITQLVE